MTAQTTTAVTTALSAQEASRTGASVGDATLDRIAQLKLSSITLPLDTRQGAHRPAEADDRGRDALR